MKFSDGSEMQVSIGTVSQKIELIKYSVLTMPERALPPMTRSEFKTLIDELTAAYEGTPLCKENK